MAEIFDFPQIQELATSHTNEILINVLESKKYTPGKVPVSEKRSFLIFA